MSVLKERSKLQSSNIDIKLNQYIYEFLGSTLHYIPQKSLVSYIRNAFKERPTASMEEIDVRLDTAFGALRILSASVNKAKYAGIDCKIDIKGSSS